MIRRQFVWLLASVAVLATVIERVQVADRAPSWTAGAMFQRRPIAKQLPQGFVLPPADVDLKALSLVAADLDSDGDLDIVAADNSNGSIGIVVWVNDGAGHLTRKDPAAPKNLGSQPAAPSIDHRPATFAASIQPHTGAVDEAGGTTRLAPPARRWGPSLDVAAISPARATLRARAPPVLS